ncbi:hypothetical protein [Paenibacillus marinisediminis]
MALQRGYSPEAQITMRCGERSKETAMIGDWAEKGECQRAVSLKGLIALRLMSHQL